MLSDIVKIKRERVIEWADKSKQREKRMKWEEKCVACSGGERYAARIPLTSNGTAAR